jgi:hypothetical protein
MVQGPRVIDPACSACSGRERCRTNSSRRSPAPIPALPAASSRAEGGTLFLDEIGDMPMEAQTRLLRVLQQGEYTTVGGRTPIKTDVRIVAARNKDLRRLPERRAAAHRGAGGHAGQPDPCSRPARPQPQHAAEEDQGSRCSGLPERRLGVAWASFRNEDGWNGRESIALAVGWSRNCRNSATL